MKNSFILGIAGGTGSGKTTIAQKIASHFKDKVIYIPHDQFYKDQSEKTPKKRELTNYDHPDALQTDLFSKQLKELLEGKTVETPRYDFTTHTRMKETLKLSPAPIIIVEGILIFQNEDLRNLMDLKVFIDVPSDIRVLRRTKRDIEERGRTLDFCYTQYVTYTKPMHELFVEPSKSFADIIIPRGGKNEEAVSTLVHTLEKRLSV